MPMVSVLYFGPFDPFHYSPLTFYLPTPIFNSIQYTSLYPLPSHVVLWLLLISYHFLFLSLFPQVL
jgi:hypothetical protein